MSSPLHAQTTVEIRKDSDLPVLPLPLNHYPEPQNKIGNPMCHNCVAEPFFPANEAGVRKSRQNPGQPLPMFQSKNDRGDDEGHPKELAQRNRLKIRIGDVAVQPRAKENLL